jgi:hypothetical protein
MVLLPYLLRRNIFLTVSFIVKYQSGYNETETCNFELWIFERRIESNLEKLISHLLNYEKLEKTKQKLKRNVNSYYLNACWNIGYHKCKNKSVRKDEKFRELFSKLCELQRLCSVRGDMELYLASEEYHVTFTKEIRDFACRDLLIYSFFPSECVGRGTSVFIC